MNLSSRNYLSQHPDSRLQMAWSSAQLGVFIFPWFPAVGAVGLAIAILSTWWQDYRQIIQRPFNWGLGILSLWLAIASCFAYQPSEAFLGLANFLPFFICFAAFSTLIQTPAQLRRLAWLLVIPSVLVVILGLGQLFLGWVTPKLIWNIFGWGLDPTGNPPGRMASVFMYANILAAYLQIVFILGLGLLVEAYQAFRQGQQKLDRRVGVFLAVAVIGDAIALVLTNSRNAWGIIILACLAFALYQGWRLLVLGVAAAATSILWASFGPSFGRQWLRAVVPAYFWTRLTDQQFPNRPVATLRLTQWEFAWSMTQQRPWTGWGLRNFTPLYLAKMKLWLGHPHNLFLMLSAEVGLPATLCFCGLVGWILAQGVFLVAHYPPESRPERVILFSYLVAFAACTLFNVLDVTLFDLRVNTLGWLLLAAIAGVVFHQRAIASD